MRDRAFGATSAVAMALFGAMWLLAAAAKVWEPLPAYEFLARAIPPGAFAKSVFVAGVAAESLLGSAMLLRAVGAVPAFAASLAGLAAAAALLLDVRSKAGGFLQCGCYGHVIHTTIDGELLRDGVMAAVLVALLAWSLRRGARPLELRTSPSEPDSSRGA